MISIDTYNFRNRRVLVRVDFNVPLNEKKEITDDTRIVTALSTIRKILTEGGSVIIMTHLGRPKGKYSEDYSVKHIVPHIEKLLAQKLIVATDCIGGSVEQQAKALKPGEVMILENLRFHPEESAGDRDFAEKLAGLGDAYVNNAFGTAHRAHASTYTIAEFFPYDKMFGYLVENEIRNIDKALKNGKSPFTAVIGGSKVSTKIDIIEALLDKVDHLIIGGGIAFSFIKAMGGEIGSSICEDSFVEAAGRIIHQAKKKDVSLHLPVDFVVADSFDREDAVIEHHEAGNIPEGFMGLDIGIKSAQNFAGVLESSSTILWNGPMGVFEKPLFASGTLKIAMAVARATDKGAFSLVGGGDSIAAVNKYSLAHKISYISTAGGALLEYIEGKKLPSIKAIKQSYSIDDYNFKDKKILVRVDFNVPLNEKGEITDDTRIVTAIPTLYKLLEDGGSIIIMTHLGRPKGEFDESLSSKVLIPRLQELLGREIKFASDCIGEDAESKASTLKSGEVLLLENLRFHPEESAGDEGFAEKLAKLGDVYVNNAFGTAHRAHASTYHIAKFFPGNRMLGYLIESEINNINRVLNKSVSPVTAIIGGSKVSTKINIIKAMIDKVDNIIIGGGIVFTFARAMGGKTGSSLIEEDYVEVAKDILDYADKRGVKFHIPSDCLIADSFSNDAKIRHCETDNIPDGWMGLDIGIRSAEKFSRIVEESATILWNGPMGVFEMPHFSTGTLQVAMAVARATDVGGYSLVGGGDSIAAVNTYSLGHRISYISTAGGALLEYLEGKELPSIKAVKGDFSE